MGTIRVFAQRRDARVELDAWRRHAERFFGAKLDAEPKVYSGYFPAADEARLVLDGAALVARGRPREERDLRDALEAEQRMGFSGMYDLARRCETVWEIEHEEGGDRTALLAAAVIASVVLGPILSGGEIFGVRTARLKLG